jgi:hypothetical protein
MSSIKLLINLHMSNTEELKSAIRNTVDFYYHQFYNMTRGNTVDEDGIRIAKIQEEEAFRLVMEEIINGLT